MKKKPFNINIFLLSTFVLGILTAVSFLSIYSADGPTEIVSPILSSIHWLLEFPTYTLFWMFIIESRNFAVYVLAYAVNCIFYGIIIERVFALNFKNK